MEIQDKIIMNINDKLSYITTEISVVNTKIEGLRKRIEQLEALE